MITKKEDFQGKSLIIPRNISIKKFKKINDKIKRLSFGNCFMGCLNYPNFKKYKENWTLYCHKNCDLLCVSNDENFEKYKELFEKISIKEFLREKRYARVSMDTGNCNEITLSLGYIWRQALTSCDEIKSLDEEGYTLKKPFIVHFEKLDTGEFLGSIFELGIHCFENTKKETMEEIKKEILDLYDSLVLSSKYKLGKKPKSWKKILKKYIKYKKVGYEN